MIYTGEPIDAERALAAGLMHRVVPRARLLEETRAVAATLAGMPQPALRGAKEAMLRGAGLPLERGLALEQAVARRADADRPPSVGA
jgi:enoyl-CoA hydratase/carnithine racemase